MPIDPLGATGPTRGQAAGPDWRQGPRGLYVPRWVDGHQVEQRVVEAAARLLEGGAVTGWAALRMRGATYFDGEYGGEELPVVLSCGPSGQLRHATGSVVVREELDAGEVTWAGGVPVVQPARALVDVCRRTRDLRARVLAVDMAAAAGALTLEGVRRYLRRRPGMRGRRQVGLAVELASEASLSPPETLLRLVWVLDAGLATPMVNVAVYDDRGRHLLTPDLLDVETGTAIEYDGAVHLSTGRRSRDLARIDRARAAGLDVVVVMAPDLREPDRLARRLRVVRERPWRRHVRWNVTPPPAAATAPEDVWALLSAKERDRLRSRIHSG